MKISENGLNFIKDQEGCVLVPYQDQTGHWTIGIGHLIQPGEHFVSITMEQALDLLDKDVARFVTAVNSYDLNLTQNQFNVLIDFAFNEGEGGLAELLSHGLDQVPDQLPRWVYSKGQVLEALVNRRAAEVKLWDEV